MSSGLRQANDLDERHNASYIHEVLISEGFEVVKEAVTEFRYRGAFRVRSRHVECEIWIKDTDFRSLPKLKILDPSFQMHSVAHFEQSGYYCYANIEDSVFDKYDPKGAMRSILDMMQDALSDHCKDDISKDIAEEFPHHWFADLVYYSAFEGDGDREAQIKIATIGGTENLIVVDHHEDRCCFGMIKKPSRQTQITPARIIAFSGALTFPNGISQPNDLKACLNWLEALSVKLADKFLCAVDVKAKSPVLTIVIQASNCAVAIKIHPTDALRNVTRSRLNRAMINALGQSVTIERIAIITGNQRYMLERNLGEEKRTLSAKKIAVIGCGTIGSHLAKLLIQSGAGFEGGDLRLIDHDLLQIQNIGRHFLGQNMIGRNKAEACAKELKRLFPEADIRGLNADITEIIQQFKGYDLVIDATGEEMLSTFINEWLLGAQQDNPELNGLFIYLFGNAVAAQALLVRPEGGACYKCLKPRHGQAWRYDPRREPRAIAQVAGACGDTPFLPYGVGGSVIAAGLASNMALGWVNDELDASLMTIRIDHAKSKTTKNVNPTPHKDCPACRRAVT